MTGFVKPLGASERKTDAKFITGRQAVNSGLALYKDLFETVAKGGLTAYADTGPVTICECHEDNGAYPDSFPLNKWGKFTLTATEQHEMTEMESLRKMLSAQWGIDIQLKKRIALPLLESLGLDSFAGMNNLFIFPMDDISIRNMGLMPEKHREIFLGFAFERNRLPSAPSGLDPRIVRTDLQIIGALLAELKINPASSHATGKLAEILGRVVN